jgi:hypothetical protein
MADSVTRLVVQIGDEDSDPEELTRLTVALRQELLDLDVNAAERARGGQPPLDSRAFEVARRAATRYSRGVIGGAHRRG